MQCLSLRNRSLADPHDCGAPPAFLDSLITRGRSALSGFCVKCKAELRAPQGNRIWVQRNWFSQRSPRKQRAQCCLVWGEARCFCEFSGFETNHLAERRHLCVLCFLGDLCENPKMFICNCLGGHRLIDLRAIDCLNGAAGCPKGSRRLVSPRWCQTFPPGASCRAFRPCCPVR